jgi:hypothetical protein
MIQRSRLAHPGPREASWTLDASGPLQLAPRLLNEADMSTFELVVGIGCAAAILSSVGDSRADCAQPRSYAPTVSGNEVTVCPTSPDSHAIPGCPAAGGMLRLDVASGAVTKLADVCVAAGTGSCESISNACASSCYVDPCVPPGSYQYGYGTPYECGDGCNTAYFVEVTVTQPLGACMSDAGAGTPVAGAPWDGGGAYGINTNCPYEEPAPAQGLPPSNGQPSNASSEGGAAEQPADASGGAGCSLVRLPRTERTVLTVDGLALLLGLSSIGRRRTKP